MRREESSYEEWEASELFCPQCRQSRPVRKKLLLILPTGRKYEYLCSGCGTSVGAKLDGDRSAFSPPLA